MRLPSLRWTIRFGAVGAVVAVALLGLLHVGVNWGGLRTHLMVLDVTEVLWPPSFWLLATAGAENTIEGWVIVALSVAANAALYALIGAGGRVRAGWRADHVLSHSAGGRHEVRNYLPAHAICNGYRWDYSPQECQWIIKIGIWARLRMEKSSALGQEMLEAFHAYETQRAKRVKRAA